MLPGFGPAFLENVMSESAIVSISLGVVILAYAAICVARIKHKRRMERCIYFTRVEDAKRNVVGK